MALDKNGTDDAAGWNVSAPSATLFVAEKSKRTGERRDLNESGVAVLSPLIAK